MTAVTVTAEHIANGERGECMGCPVWLAITDALPGLAYLAVFIQDIQLRPDPDDDDAEVEMPAEVLDFVRDFDLGLPVEPFTFELDYPAVTP